MKQTRILITGVSGQVGRELVKALGNLGAELFVSARGGRDTFWGYPCVNMDMSNPSGVRETLNRIKPTLLINPAAYTQVDKAETEQELASKVNAESVGVMAEAIKQIGGAMIHFSTDYVYNPSHNRPISEEEATHPSNVYAQSKLNGERALQEVSLPHLIFRTSWVYGPKGKHFAKTMLKLAKERESLGIVNDQIGAPTSARCIALAVLQILSKGQQDPVAYIQNHSGIYNLCNRGETSWFTYANYIFELARATGVKLALKETNPILTKDYPTPASRPLNSRLSTEKIEACFGIRMEAWQTALEEYFSSYLINGELT